MSVIIINNLCETYLETDTFLLYIYFYRKYAAILEEEAKTPIFTVYDLIALKQIKSLRNPFKEYTSNYFHSLRFICDNKCMLAVLGSPDWVVLSYHWQKGNIINKFNALPKSKGSVSKVNILTKLLIF